MSEISRKDLTKEFQSYYLITSLPSMRLGFTLTLIMFFFFAVFNILIFPESPEQLFYNHFWVVSPILIISILVTYIRPLYNRLHAVYIILNLVMGLCVFYVGFISSPLVKGYDHYFAWVMVVVIGLFTFYRMSFTIIISIGAFQVLAYILATLLNGTFRYSPFIFFNDLFFVLSIYSVGFFMAFMVRKLSWRNFLHAKVHAENYKKLLGEIKERKQVEQSLQQSQFMYINTLNSIPDWIYVLDKELRFVILNNSLQEEHLRQGFPVNCIGKKISKVYPFIPSSTIDEINQVFKTGELIIGEQQFFLRDKTIYGETRKVPIFRDNQVHQVMTIMRNRSKEKEIEQLKQKNFEQKEIMLREIHHRVKNNLAIVISLLNLQLRNNSDPDFHRMIRDIEMRIRSMALIHEHLYRSEDLDRIPLGSYLQSLVEIITGTFSGRKVKIVNQLEAIDISIETALPLGLIANELLTNAFKYAFNSHIDGEISVHLRKEDADSCLLIIQDNGVGLPANFSMDSEKSLGMFIVKLLVEQIEGKIEVARQNGTAFIISFKNPIMKKQVSHITESHE